MLQRVTRGHTPAPTGRSTANQRFPTRGTRCTTRLTTRGEEVVPQPTDDARTRRPTANQRLPTCDAFRTTRLTTRGEEVAIEAALVRGTGHSDAALVRGIGHDAQLTPSVHTALVRGTGHDVSA